VECTNNRHVLLGSSLLLPSLPAPAAGEARPLTACHSDGEHCLVVGGTLVSGLHLSLKILFFPLV